MDILEKLFGGVAKIRMLRLFLLNPEYVFPAPLIAKRVKARAGDVRKELSLFEKIGLVKRRSTTYEKRKSVGYVLDQTFPYLRELSTFLVSARPMTDKELSARFARAGRIKLIVLAGMFLKHDEESRVDILIVGDDLRPKALQHAVASIEADMGREVLFAAFETPDFKYRMGICDKLVRDIFEFPHIVVQDKLSVS